MSFISQEIFLNGHISIKKKTKTTDDGDSSVARWELGVLALLQNWVDDAVLKHGGDATVYQHAIKH